MRYEKEIENLDLNKLEEYEQGVEREIKDTSSRLHNALTMNDIVGLREELAGLFNWHEEIIQAQQEVKERMRNVDFIDYLKKQGAL